MKNVATSLSAFVTALAICAFLAHGTNAQASDDYLKTLVMSKDAGTSTHVETVSPMVTDELQCSLPACYKLLDSSASNLTSAADCSKDYTLVGRLQNGTSTAGDGGYLSPDVYVREFDTVGHAKIVVKPVGSVDPSCRLLQKTKNPGSLQ